MNENQFQENGDQVFPCLLRRIIIIITLLAAYLPISLLFI